MNVIRLDQTLLILSQFFPRCVLTLKSKRLKAAKIPIFLALSQRPFCLYL